jgi:hypothetical protein
MKLHAEVQGRSGLRGAPALLQRKPGKSGCGCGSCDKCKGAALQRSATASNDFGEAPPIVHEALRGQGRPLDAQTRSYFEPRLGQDFSEVRVHTGGLAAQSARAVAARAYTVGSDVVFDEGRFAPHSVEGRHLLGHELAHVVQQRGGGLTPGTGLRVGAANDAYEAAADRAADAVARGGHASPGAAQSGVLRRAPGDAPAVPSPLIAMNQSLASVELEEGEAASKDNPKLVQVAESYKANPSARVRLSAYLTSGAQNSSAQESAERGKLNTRMRAIRDALKALGVPEDAIDLSPATGYSTSAHGQVGVDVSKRTPLNLLPAPLAPTGTPLQPAPGPAPQGGSGLPSLNLDFEFGPVKVSLPKEVRAKLPVAFRGGKSLVIELGYEVPAKFSFKITLDGTPYVRVSLKAGAEVDAKSGATTGSAGLQIDTLATTCNAPDPGETREKIKSAGDKLNKAAQEFKAAQGSDQLSKAFDIASAIGEMYDAVDKAKSKCKPVPRASFELGYKHLLTPGSETDPRKQPPTDYIGVTGTFHF